MFGGAHTNCQPHHAKAKAGWFAGYALLVNLVHIHSGYTEKSYAPVSHLRVFLASILYVVVPKGNQKGTPWRHVESILKTPPMNGLL